MSNPNTGIQPVWQADLQYTKDSVKTVPQAATSSVTTVASSTTSATMLAANASRTGLVLSNSDANAFYGRFGGTAASATAFSVTIPAGGTIQLSPAPKEALQGIWPTAGTGYLGITELSA